MLKLESRVLLGERRYRVSAVLWLGERYYLLVRDSGPATDIALLPAAVAERLAIDEPPKKPRPKLRRVK